MAARPSRLIKNRHGTYCLRWIVPVALRKIGDAREVRVSLRTTDASKARILVLEFNLALERLRLMTKDTQPLPQDLLAKMVISIGSTTWDIQTDADRLLFEKMFEGNSEMRQALRTAITSGVAPADAMADLVQQVRAATVSASPVAHPTSLVDAIEKFEGSRASLDGNRRNTPAEKRRTMQLLHGHLVSRGRPPSIHVHEIGRDDLLDFVNEFAKRPAKGKIVDEAPAPKKSKSGPAGEVKVKAKPLAARTVLKAIGHLENFYLYALTNNWVAVTPLDEAFHKSLAGLRKGATGAKRTNSYALFSEREIKVIFDPVTYLANLRAADDFWAPLIGLYTGARLGEIVTLSAEDICLDQDHGLHVMHVVDGKGKNANSLRKVPIPQALVDLGLLRYVDHVKALGATSLFPHRELNATREDDPSKHVSRVFGEHLDAVGIKAKSRVFHSFRHTVITALHVNQTPVGDAELIVGHAAQDYHEQLSKGAGRSGGQSSTHLGTYADAAGYDVANLFGRLRAHMERCLKYPLKFAALTEAANIVLELTIKKPDGTFSSGWHSNNRVTGPAMLKRVAAALSSSAEPAALSGAV